MPTYEYECESCGYRFEKFQSITAKTLKKCPKCGKKLRRLIGEGSGIIFKGSGFYATDYKRSGSSPSSMKPKSDSSSKDASSKKEH